jgi:DNA repair protein RadC
LHHWNKGKINIAEEFKVLFLNRQNRVRQLLMVSQGGITATHADPRLIMAVALKVKAHSMILAHNHPSENLQPSVADKSLTTKLKDAALILNMRVFDHIIVTPNGYFSFSESGLL